MLLSEWLALLFLPNVRRGKWRIFGALADFSFGLVCGMLGLECRLEIEIPVLFPTSGVFFL